MAKFNLIQNSFNSGELDPKLKGRSDIKEYGTGCETLENMLIMPAGGVTRRPGTQYIDSIEEGGTFEDAVLFPFVYDYDTSYIIALSYDSPYVKILSKKTW